MRIDKGTAIASWVVSLAVAGLSIWLLFIAGKGLFTGEVPTINRYAPSRIITGMEGVFLALSYISFSIALMFSAISIKLKMVLYFICGFTGL